MKKSKHALCTIGIMTMLSISAYAQVRSIDMEAILDSPVAGGVYTNGESVPFTVSVKNNGPDDLIVGDTLFLSVQGSNVITIILSTDVNKDQSAVIFSQDAPLSVSQPPFTGDICAYIYNPNTDIKIGGVPAELSYEDLSLENNMACNTVTINPTGGTAIDILKEPITEQLTLYPNPASSELLISINLNKLEKVNISVKDITGRTVLHKGYNQIQGTGNVPLSLDVSALPEGLYFLELNAGSKTTTGKFIIQR